VLLLVALTLGGNLLTVSLSCIFLVKSRQLDAKNVAVTAQNLTQVLEQNITGIINKADVGIFALAQEVARQIASGGIDEEKLARYMAQAQSLLPELEGLRVANERGNVLYGLRLPSEIPYDCADQDYFKRLRDNPGAGLVVSRPIKGRITGKWGIVLARRISLPDGSFAGVAFGIFTLNQLDRLFASINAGKHGVFALRDGGDLALVVHYTEPEETGRALGQKKISDECMELLKKGITAGTYDAPSVLDRRIRTWGFRKFSDQRYIIFVGLDQDELLAEWHKEALGTGLFLTLFALVSTAASRAIYLVWKRNRADEVARAQAYDLERRQTEKLLHSQKLESLGVLAGGIAHDFNNILTAIIGNADLALMRLPPESPVMENLRRIEQAAIRAADLARQMLAYSGKGRFVIEPIDLNHLVQEMGHMLDVSISKKVLLNYHLAPDLATVEGDATQIRQIVMNLVLNASEAIGDESGMVTIATGLRECDEGFLRNAWIGHWIEPGCYLFIEVSDTGCGMDQETQERMYDPFFTTKFAGRGLGMAAVLGIVRGHKGTITVASQPGSGTTFTVLLPAGGSTYGNAGHGEGDPDWTGNGTVLLVDDEETIRAMGSDMLRELGFQVLTAVDGLDALEKSRSRDDIGVVILDLTMPHMDGEQAFRELRSLLPEAKIFMSSGYDELEMAQKFGGKGVAGFIHKPYKLSALRDVLSRCV